MSTKEIDSIAVSNKQENLLFEKDFNIIVDEVNDFIFKLLNKGTDDDGEKQNVIDYIENNNINPQEIYNWLLNNQYNSNSIFLLGYFNYCGIETSKNKKKHLIYLLMHQKTIIC